MSRALKCDRCGQCFCPGDAEYVSSTSLLYAAGDRYVKRFDNFDLCLACSNEFKNWMNKVKTKTCDGDEF